MSFKTRSLGGFATERAERRVGSTPKLRLRTGALDRIVFGSFSWILFESGLTCFLCVREVGYVGWAASFSYKSALLACAIWRWSQE